MFVQNQILMKSLKKFTLLCLAIGLFSCSSSDDSDDQPTNTGNYFPSTVDDLWIYNVVNASPDDPAANYTGTDLVEVNSSTTSSFTVTVNGGTPPVYGTLNTLLQSGTLMRTASDLKFSGTVSLPDELAGFFNNNINISLSNVVLYDVNASNNEELSINSDTLSQDLTIDTTTLPLTIDYQFISKSSGFSNSEIVDGQTYNDVVKTKLTLNVTVTTQIDVVGTPVTYSVIDNDDVLIIDTMYAKDVGLIKASSQSGFELSPEIITLINLLNPGNNIPTSGSSTNNQELDSYVVASN